MKTKKSKRLGTWPFFLVSVNQLGRKMYKRFSFPLKRKNNYLLTRRLAGDGIGGERDVTNWGKSRPRMDFNTQHFLLFFYNRQLRTKTGTKLDGWYVRGMLVSVVLINKHGMTKMGEMKVNYIFSSFLHEKSTILSLARVSYILRLLGPSFITSDIGSYSQIIRLPSLLLFSLVLRLHQINE